MSSNKKHILIVDDSADDIHILMENLKQDYTILAATNGQKAIELANREPRPDAILLDVMMEGMDGYETCRALKNNPDTSDIDVIFVSAQDTTDEKLAGFEAGASDYLIKPVQPTELRHKVKLAVDSREEKAIAAEEKTVAMETAMTAISSAGEQGVALDFMRRSFTIDSIEELARLIVEAVSNYSLENSVQIRSSHGTINSSTSEPIPPLEKEILTRLKDSGRLQEFGKRFFANFGNISLLVKNMPDDADKQGRLRDHLAILLEGAEAKLKSLELDQQLAQLIIDAKQSLKNIESMQIEQKKAGVKIMDDTLEELEESFMSYGLTEEQEELLSRVVQNGVEKTLDNFERGVAIDEELKVLISRLESF